MGTAERRFLIFYLHADRYALDLEFVEEVMNPVRSWPIPFASSCYTGAINFHGAIVAVMDLALFLNHGAITEPEKIIVLSPKTASLGFLVGRVEKIIPLQETELKEPPEVSCVSAVLALPEGDALLLDTEAIVIEAERAVNR